jgi:hypothetical protein
MHERVQFFRGDGTQVTPLGKVRADPAMGIFGGPAFPGEVWRGEGHTGGLGDAFLRGACGPVIEGQGMDTSAPGAPELHGRLTEGLSGAVGERGEPGVAALAFPQETSTPRCPWPMSGSPSPSPIQRADSRSRGVTGVAPRLAPGLGRPGSPAAVAPEFARNRGLVHPQRQGGLALIESGLPAAIYLVSLLQSRLRVVSHRCSFDWPVGKATKRPQFVPWARQ